MFIYFMLLWKIVTQTFPRVDLIGYISIIQNVLYKMVIAINGLALRMHKDIRTQPQSNKVRTSATVLEGRLRSTSVFE